MRNERSWILIGIGAAGLFIGSIFWSIWFDTLQPLIRAGDTAGLIAHLIGIPIILGGTVVLCYGGFRFTRDTFGVWGDLGAMPKEAAHSWARLPKPEQKRRYRAMLWKAWQRPLLWLVLGLSMIAAGGFVINLPGQGLS